MTMRGRRQDWEQRKKKPTFVAATGNNKQIQAQYKTAELQFA